MEYFAFQWHITEDCDQRCRHCYIYALGSHAKFKEMALEDMVTVIENCKAFCEKAGRLPYLYITGGDPILHPQLWTLMKILKLADIPFALMGNPLPSDGGGLPQAQGIWLPEVPAVSGRAEGDPRRYPPAARLL